MELEGDRFLSLESRENGLDTRKIILEGLTEVSLKSQEERRRKLGLKKCSKKHGSNLS